MFVWVVSYWLLEPVYRIKARKGNICSLDCIYQTYRMFSEVGAVKSKSVQLSWRSAGISSIVSSICESSRQVQVWWCFTESCINATLTSVANGQKIPQIDLPARWTSLQKVSLTADVLDSWRARQDTLLKQDAPILFISPLIVNIYLCGLWLAGKTTRNLPECCWSLSVDGY